MSNTSLEIQSINWLSDQCNSFADADLIPPNHLGDGIQKTTGWYGINSNSPKHRGKYAYNFNIHGENRAITITFKSFKNGGVILSHTFVAGKHDDTFESRDKILDVIERQSKAKAKAQADREKSLEGIKSLFFDTFSPAPRSHPYLEKKQASFGQFFRYHSNKIYIPIFHSMPVDDGKNELISYQSIDGKGKKLFPKGGATAGGFYPIGMVDQPDLIFVAEGCATGYSVHLATGKPVIVAFSAPNLLPISKKLREWYPNCPIVLAGDDDRWTPAGNAGRLASEKVLNEVANSYACFPNFDGLDISSQPTDFNDLFCLIKNDFDDETASEEVASQLEVVTNAIPRHLTFTGRYHGKVDLSSPGTYIFKGGMGTGKTQAVIESIRSLIDQGEDGLIVINPSRSLIDALSHRFTNTGIELFHYLDTKKLSKIGEMVGDTYVSNSIVCCNSVHKLDYLATPERASQLTLFIDESEQAVRQLSTMENNDGLLENSFLTLKKLVKFAKRVITADAFTSNLTNSLLECRSDKPRFIVDCAFLPGEGRTITEFHDFDLQLDAVSMRLQDGRAFVATDSLKKSEYIFNFLSKQGKKGLLLNGDTTGGKAQIEFLVDPTREADKYDFIVCSPSVSSGISINESARPFDVVAGFFTNFRDPQSLGRSGPTTEDAWQQLFRVRAPVDLLVWIDGRRETEPTNVAEILDNLEFAIVPQKWGAIHAKMSESERVEFSKRIDSVRGPGGDIMTALRAILGSEYTRLQAAVIAKMNTQKNDFRYSFNKIALAMGFKIVDVKDKATKEVCQAVAKAKKEAKASHFEAIATAKDLTQKEFDKLVKKKHKPRPAEVLEKEKFELRQEYKQEVTVDLVTWDNRGEGRRVLRRIDRLMNPRLAMQEDADELVSLFKGEKSPFMVGNHQRFFDVYTYILGVAGYSIENGKVVHDGRALTNDDLVENGFALAVRQRERVLGLFHKVSDLRDTPMRVLQTFLEDLGLRLKGKKLSKGNKTIRSYSADQTELAKINQFIEVRKAG